MLVSPLSSGGLPLGGPASLPSATASGRNGMRTAQQQHDSAAHRIANLQTPDSQGFQTLADDLVAQRVSVYSFAANLRTVQTQDRMLGTLLDAKA